MKKRNELLKELSKDVVLLPLRLIPGVKIILDLIPETSNLLIKNFIESNNSKDDLESTVQKTFESVTNQTLQEINASPGSNEYNAVLQAILDFKSSLAKTPFTIELIIKALAEPLALESAILSNRPTEHIKWASDLRHSTFEKITHRFSAVILTILPQLPAVQALLNVETLRRLDKIETMLQSDIASKKITHGKKIRKK